MSSSWEIKGIPKFSKLPNDITAEVCVIGGGLAGVWCAYLLSKAGKHVVLIEKDRVGEAATMYTTAFLTHSIDTDLRDLVDMFGRVDAKRIWQSHADAIDLIEKTIKKEKIECEFKRVDNYNYAADEKEFKYLEEEHKLAQELGFPSKLVHSPFPGFRNIGGQILRKQGKYHPMKFFQGLLETAIEQGTEVFEHTEAIEVSGRSVITVRTKSGEIIRAADVIVTTYDPFNNPKPVHFKKGMYESYVYELRVKHGLIPEGIYEDMKNPYHYFRVDAGSRFDRIIVGGEDHRAELLKALEKKSFKALAEWIDASFPKLKYTIEKRWHGGILEPVDGLALIGEYAPHQYLATAFSGNGMTYSALTGMILTDLILGKKNAYAAIFDPKRKLDKKALMYKAADYGEELFKGAGRNLFK